MTTLRFPRHALPMGVRVAEFDRDGHRAMTAVEGEALRWGQLVAILDSSSGDRSYGTVHSFAHGESVRVDLRNGATLDFDLDNPDLWAEDREGERNPPMCEVDGRTLVLVTTSLLPAVEKEPTPLFNAIKASVELVALRKRVAALEAQVKVQADALQGMPTREEYDAMFADMSGLHQAVKVALELRKAS